MAGFYAMTDLHMGREISKETQLHKPYNSEGIHLRLVLIPFLHFNPITYGVLTFRQLRGRLFGPDPENKVTVNGLI